MKRFDVLALISGVVFTVVAVLALWQSLIGPLNWHALQISGPLVLIGLGLTGLALSRSRD